jgi:hypothetical protein
MTPGGEYVVHELPLQSCALALAIVRISSGITFTVSFSEIGRDPFEVAIDKVRDRVAIAIVAITTTVTYETVLRIGLPPWSPMKQCYG